MKYATLILIVLFATASARASDRAAGDLGGARYFHVTLTYPAGGEVFTSGTVMRIEWQEIQAHNMTNWDLFYSTDGGAVFHAIKYDLPKEARSYQWIVPEKMTSQARVRVIQDNDIVDYVSDSPDFTIQATATGTERAAEMPVEPVLLPAFPNPFSSSTTIGFNLATSGHVRLEVFDVAGRSVAVLTDGAYATGTYRLRWDGRRLGPGLYFYRLTAGNRVSTLAMTRAH